MTTVEKIDRVSPSLIQALQDLVCDTHYRLMEKPEDQRPFDEENLLWLVLCRIDGENFGVKAEWDPSSKRWRVWAFYGSHRGKNEYHPFGEIRKSAEKSVKSLQKRLKKEQA